MKNIFLKGQIISRIAVFLCCLCSLSSYAQVGTLADPFTSLLQSSTVTTAGQYYFDIGGTTFDSYVDANGYLQIAIDFGNGTGNLPQGTSLDLSTRGILNPTVLASLTETFEIRITSSSGTIDYSSTHPDIASRIQSNTTLHQGSADNEINDYWTGVNDTYLTVNASCVTGSGTSLHQNIVHVCGAAGSTNWIPSGNYQRERWSDGEIANAEYFQLWVKGNTNCLNTITSLDQAAGITEAGIYCFEIGGETFETYVDENGYVQLAIDFGNGAGNLTQSTALNTFERGILNTTVLATLNETKEVRISTNTGNFDVTTTNATIITRIQSNATLHQGSADNGINNDWTGTNSGYITANASCATGSGTSLHQNIGHICGNSGAFHWIPSSNLQRENYGNGEIGNTEYFKLWVRGQAPSPGSIGDDLVLWLKGDAGITGESPITQWKDQSENGFTSTIGGNPSKVNNSANGNSVVRFDGSGDYILTGLTSDPDVTDLSLFAIYKSPAATGGNQHIFAQQDGTGTGRSIMYIENGVTDMSTFLSGSSSRSTDNITYDEWDLYCMTLDANGASSDINFYQKGDPDGSFTRNPEPANGNWVIGSHKGTGSAFLEGDIAELIVYEQEVSGPDRNKIESYLAIKYGITLDNSLGGIAGDYVASNGDPLWDALTNAAYHNDVAGIGRDDNAGLDQRKSLSINNDAMVIMDKEGVFPNNSDFVLWGNDNTSTNFTESDIVSGYYKRLERVWKASVNGSPGAVTVKIIRGNTGVIADYGLHIDSDGTFVTGATTVAATSISGDTISFENVTLADGDHFTLGSKQGAPGGVSSGLNLWLRGDAGPNTAVDGDPVATWGDTSGESNDATAAGASDNPTFVSEFLNFNPAVHFENGDNGYFDVNLDHIKNSDYNLITVLKRDNNNTYNYILGTTQSSANRGLHYGYRWNTSLTLAQYSNDINVTVDGYDDTNPQPVLVRGQLDQSSGKLISELKEGVVRSNTDGGTGALTGTAAGTLGRGFDNRGYEGYAAEVIAYSSTLSEIEIQKIYSYLGIKYGLTLTANNDGDGTNFETPNGDGVHEGDYVLSDGTVIWDGPDNSGYYNDIAGIGRDDRSSLNQLKSKSSNSDGIVIMEKDGSFTDNHDFLVWGNDDASTSYSTNDKVTGFYTRMERVWKVSLNGSPGAVNVLILRSNTGMVADYGLHIDADGTFETGSTTIAPSSISGDTLIFENVTFTHGEYFTLGSNQTAPGGITQGLNVWLKGDLGPDTSVDGDPVATWNDQSGQRNNASQNGASDLPTYVSEHLNFNPSIHFENGDNGYFDLDLDGIKDSDYNLIGVLERDNNNTYSYILGTTATSGNQGLHFGYRNNTSLTIAQYGNDIDVSVVGYDVPEIEPVVIRGQLDQTSGKIISELRTGTYISNNHGNTAALTGTAAGKLGRGFDGRGFEGHASEIIAYSKTLDATELQKIYSYLGVKYGLTLTKDDDEDGTDFEEPNGDGIMEGDYITANGTVIWDASANTTYYNDIAGIGRDDRSALNQQQSMSSNSDAMVIMDKGGSFDNDRDFMLWGNNDGGTDYGTVDLTPGFTQRMKRQWRVRLTGSPGSVTLKMVTPNKGTKEDIALIVDADGTFATDAASYFSTSINGDTIVFENISFNDGDHFTLGVIQRYPGSVNTDLTLWFKGNGGVYATTADPDLNDWRDQSTGANNATGTGDAIFSENFSNYNPGIAFTDDVQPISGSVERTNGTGSTIFMVGEIPSLGDRCFMEIGTGSERAFLIDRRYAGNTSYNMKTGDQGVWTVSDPGGSSNASIFEDGKLFDDQPKTFDTDWTTGGAFYIGDDRTGGNRLNGSIGEIIYYDRQLSAADQLKVESYLSIKYGLTISPNQDGDINEFEAPNANGINEGDYVSGNGTVIWDASENSEYHNDVIGIGRAEGSGLNQKQSRTKDDKLRVFVDSRVANNASNAGSITNDESYLMIGHDGGKLQVGANHTEKPSSVTSRFEREWKVTNTNFDDEFTIEFEWDEVGAFDITHIRLLIDDDPDLTDATILGAPLDGLTITEGSIIISGFNTSHIPANSTRYISIASINTSTVLPIELLEFNAEVLDESVELEWITATETNNDYFSIERTKDGEIWEVIQTTPGAGNSLHPLRYLAMDNEPYGGTSYYRLKQTDFDGKFTYSDIKSVYFEATSSIFIYPTVISQDDLNIFIDGINDEKLIDISIFDLAGNHVYFDKIPDQTIGISRLAINIRKELSLGTYVVVLSSSEGMSSHRIFIQ